MDELVVKQLTRQLKVLNLWLSIFGTIIVVALVVIGVLIYKIVSFAHHTADQVNDIRSKTSQTLNAQKKLCDSDNLNKLLDKKTSICD